MAKQPIVIFVEDYKNMSKEEFATYIKKIWNEGYEAGRQERNGNYPFLTDNLTWTGNVTGDNTTGKYDAIDPSRR